MTPSRSHRLRWPVLREDQVFLALTLIVGVLSGLSAVLFSLAIDEVQARLFGPEPSQLRYLLVPTVVSLVTGFLLWKYFTDVRGSGVPQTKTAYHLHQGYMAPHVPVGKFLTAALCIGSGHAMGREGPSVQIGAGLASLIGRWLRLSPERVRSLVPVGAAGALAAAFNTPVAAVLFALEEIIGNLNAELLGSTVLASVSAVVVMRSILGNEPLFSVPPYELAHPAELLAYAVLGILGGVISLAFSKGLLRLRASFKRMPRWSVPLQPMVGGIALGLILLYMPEVMGVGYEYVDQALNEGLPFTMLVLLCLVKLVATVVSYASGNAGGIFAPSLFLGAMLGGAVGFAVQQVGAFPVGGPGAYALVGMGALFAGIIRAPMTSVFMIFEITQDYAIIVPLIVANMLSFLISRRYQKVPLYHALLEQDDIHLPSSVSHAAGRNWFARDIMGRVPMFVPDTATIEEAATVLDRTGLRCGLVGSADRLEGLVLRDVVEDAMRAGQGDKPVKSVLVADWGFVYPDHPLELTLERFKRGHGVLPVLSRTGARRLEGVITHDTVLNFLGQHPAAARAVEEKQDVRQELGDREAQPVAPAGD